MQFLPLKLVKPVLALEFQYNLFQRKFTLLCGTFALFVSRRYSRVKIFIISMTKYAVTKVAQFPCIHRRLGSNQFVDEK